MSLGFAYFLGPMGQTLDLFKSFVNTSQKVAPYSGLLSNDQALCEHSRPSNESFRKKVNVCLPSLNFPSTCLRATLRELIRRGRVGMTEGRRAGGENNEEERTVRGRDRQTGEQVSERR